MANVARTVLLAVALVAVAIADAAAAPDYRDADYWAFADRSFEAIDDWWVPEEDAYVETTHRTPQTRTNAGLLAIHAIAAHQGHLGRARNDERARILAARMADRWVGRGLAPAPTALTSADSWTHCWSSSMNKRNIGHASVDAQIADALAWAWRARRALDLPSGLSSRIAGQLRRCAGHPYWRGPGPVSTQINWNTAIFAAGAMATGDGGFLRNRYRRLVGWFVGGIERRTRDHATTNLGPGYAFRYLPVTDASHRFNFDIPEYANLVVQFIEVYDRARRAGMRPLSARGMQLMRAWVQRLVAGSWTHAGFLNWDTGYGRERWFSAQYWAFAQQGLIAIASSPTFRSEAYGRWAKAIFDRGLELYRRFGEEADRILPPLRLYGVASGKESLGPYHVRMALNAARAAARGLGSRRSSDPPPLYAFDMDTGRLAVTTSRYSTAIVPDNRGAFDYGGIELARLFGPRGRVAANVGGRPSSAFGVVAYARSGRTLLASQRVRAAPLRLVRSPQGTRPTPYPARPFAGPFRSLAARGAVARNGVRVTTTHSFTRTTIGTRWDLRCPRACHRARVLFPSWGSTATIDAVLRVGGAIRLAGPGASPYVTAVRLGEVRGLVVTGAEAGYRLALSGPARATLRTLQPGRQPTNPDPGPTLALELPGGSALRHVRVAARIVPR